MPSRGFTIVEILAVMVVLAVLATAAMPLSEMTVRRSKEAELKEALWEIRAAIDAYKRAADTGKLANTGTQSGYPSDLVSLAAGVDGVRQSGVAKRLFFLRRIPRDPFADPALPAEKTWGLRSYASTALDPKEGEDVYDVFSRSKAIGLNNVRYSDW